MSITLTNADTTSPGAKAFIEGATALTSLTVSYSATLTDNLDLALAVKN